MEAAAKKALEESMADLHSRAVQLAPIDTGDLRSSARHEVNTTTDGMEGIVNFDARYALAQHEGFFQHPKGGQRKYLETPFRQQAGRYGRHIAKAIREAVER